MLFLHYYPLLTRFTYHFVRSSETAEDLVQEVFTRIWEIRSDWNPVGNLKAYLYKAAKNRALDFLKAQRVRSYADLNADDPELLSDISLERQINGQDFQSAAQQAIRELPDRCRLIYLLHREEGLTYSEIASSLEISVKTVEAHMSHALKILRRRLAVYL